jgi:propionyl-CoA carboxylase alpha chain
VYAEDPSRNFLPSIGHLKKYREPDVSDPSKRVRIDTGVEEGSEISMYYDPMISKLITWGKDREEAGRILDRAFDEYVIRGVTHNLGFGKSILANPDFASGNYGTGFIEKWYPEGFTGDDLTPFDHRLLSVVGHQIKCINENYGKRDSTQLETQFIRVKSLRDAPHADYKVERLSDSDYQITDLATGATETLASSDFDFQYNTLITLKLNGEDQILQYNNVKNDGLSFSFSYKGNNVELAILDEKQYQHLGHMPEPAKLDHAKSIISPMPGAVVQVLVQPGDTVVAGQQLLVIEAMKMQNVIKAERDAVVEAVNVKAGDSVAVDELMIQMK